MDVLEHHDEELVVRECAEVARPCLVQRGADVSPAPDARAILRQREPHRPRDGGNDLIGVLGGDHPLD